MPARCVRLSRAVTRINLVPVRELYDPHLFAEFREIKMVPRSLERSLAARGAVEVLARIPSAYVLGKGHVSFFYNKGQYLRHRYSQIRRELFFRLINFDQAAPFDPNRVMYDEHWNHDYKPTPEALAMVRARIAERVAMRSGWYRRTPHGSR
jgi:deoxyribonuclease (pyrimidine dimer)